ncbi:YfhO family protein [Herpetosiphon llansteffanensis]|uniref:YfhO family protein n=1 Tax=Herpetosiphon llansteffanensis TaxID=2094568 RepID=UPI000D7C6DA1|nr:YfhO family protein [Herpetosiphon llansteffanensis]
MEQRSFSGQWQRWWPYLCITLVALLLMWRVVLGNTFLPLDIVAHLHPWRFSYERVAVNNPINSDLVTQIYPRRLVTNQLLEQGALPLWNPTILTGTPLLADGQLAFFYPLSWLFVLLPLRYAFGIYTLINVWLAGVGSYKFARRMQLAPMPASLAAVGYMLSGFLLNWLHFPEFSAACAMLPWCFWAVLRASQSQRWRDWLQASLVLALPLVSQIQLAFYCYLGIGCLLLYQLSELPSWRLRFKQIAQFSSAIGLALGLSAVQLLPQIALSAQGQRLDIGSGLGSASSIMLWLLRLGLPIVDGAARENPSAWQPHLLQGVQPYAGLLTLGLALLAIWRSQQRGVKLFALVALGSFAIAVGTPLLQLLLWLLAPYRQFADHQRWFGLWGFAMAMLAGYGLQSLQQPLAKPTRALWLQRGVLVLGMLGLAGWMLQHIALFTANSRYAQYSTLLRLALNPISLGIFGLSMVALACLLISRIPRRWANIVVLIVLVGDLLWYGRSYNTSVDPNLFHATADMQASLATEPALQDAAILYPPTRQINFLLHQPGVFRVFGADYQAMPTNVFSAFGLEDIRGYQSLYLAQYNRLTRLMDGKDYHKLGEGGNSLHAYFTMAYNQRRLLNMLNVEYLIFTPNSPNPELYQPLELVQRNDEGTIYRNPEVLPRAWMVYQTEVIDADLAQLDRLAASDFDPATQAIVAEPVPALGPAPTQTLTPSLRYGPNQATVQVDTPAAGLLVLADAYTSDWQVTVDGQPTKLYRTNYALRGVWLAAGQHTVEFRYQPQSLIVGSWVSGLSLGLSLLSLLVNWIRVKRKAAQ